jgi:hypothetical protein
MKVLNKTKERKGRYKGREERSLKKTERNKEGSRMK